MSERRIYCDERLMCCKGGCIKTATYIVTSKTSFGKKYYDWYCKVHKPKKDTKNQVKIAEIDYEE